MQPSTGAFFRRKCQEQHELQAPDIDKQLEIQPDQDKQDGAIELRQARQDISNGKHQTKRRHKFHDQYLM